MTVAPRAALDPRTRARSGGVLRLAGVYNVLWGTAVILFPHETFVEGPAGPLHYPELWQCVGMIVGVYGVGYWIAASDPVRHWPVILVGWLGKVLGPFGTVLSVLQDRLPLEFGVHNVFNDLIWWVPFTWMLYRVWQVEALAPSCDEQAVSDARQSD